MTVEDRLRAASKATRGAFAGRDVPNLDARGRRRTTVVAVGVLVAIVVVGVSLAAARRDDRPSRVAAGGGGGGQAQEDDPGGRATAVATASTVPSTRSDVNSGGAELLERGPLSPRGGQSVVWSGREVIVWGGWGDEAGHMRFADGAAYDLAKARWRRVAQAPLGPRRNHAAAWTGREMLIVGGDGRRDAAAYDPDADSWRALPPAPFGVGNSENLRDEGRAVTSDALYIWNVAQDRLATFDFARGRWDDRPGPGLGAVNAGALRVVGDHLVAVATTSYTGSPLLVATSDLGASTWTRHPDSEFPEDRNVPDVDPNWSAVTGDELIIWSESRTDAVLAFDVGAGTWRPRAPHQLPPCEGAPPPETVAGGFLASSCGTTARYEAATDSWQRVDLGDLSVSERESVWTGDRIVSWGHTCCYGTGGAPFKANVAWTFSPAP